MTNSPFYLGSSHLSARPFKYCSAHKNMYELLKHTICSCAHAATDRVPARVQGQADCGGAALVWRALPLIRHVC